MILDKRFHDTKTAFSGKLKATNKMARKFGVGKWYYKLQIGWLQIADNLLP